ncbi:MAG: sortase domain-containing protein [Nocardioides sp.]
MARSALAAAAVLLIVAPGLASCSESPPRSAPTTESPTESPSSPPSSPTPESVEPQAPSVTMSDGQPRRARLSIPALGLRDLAVVPYRGKTDDAPGTRIQDGGVAASPYGRRGGVGPGGLGNYQVTAHRTSSTAAFRNLPSLRIGQLASVTARDVRYVYEIRRTRRTSFRSPRSLAEQRAAVPGRPGTEPRRAFLTLSTCLTQEDHAQGNFWADEFNNPEHRVDKIGVLVRTVEPPQGSGRGR